MQPVAKGYGILYLVSTPIGNLKDMTFRGVEVLSSVENIAAEDTRKSRVLLDHYRIKPKRLHSYFGPKEGVKAEGLLKLLLAGESVALITDAGTPGISDPAGKVVRLAIESGVTVVPIPGPTALLAALPVSGLDTSSFVYDGFLPIKSGRRRSRLKELLSQERTVVIYESTHRILKLLDELEEEASERRVVVARELTKLFEEFLRGTPGELKKLLIGKKTKGEFVVMIAGRSETR